MKKLLVALVVSAVGAAVVIGAALAHGPGPVRPATGRVVKIQSGRGAELTIVHLLRGCHNWTDGKTIAEKADVALKRDARLTILNQDVDVHKLVQLAGPTIATGKGLTMNASVKLRFAKVGLYRFKTVTSEMPGMPAMKTIGPDYELVLVVRVT